MTEADSNPVSKAQQILRGAEASPEEILSLAHVLKAESNFRLARMLLNVARRDPAARQSELALTLALKCALYTVQDDKMPRLVRLDAALDILSSEVDLATTENQEALGLAGHIMKRKWQQSGQRQYLVRALAYYDRGSEPVEGDWGSSAINAAFLLDQRAYLEDEDATTVTGSVVAEEYRNRALSLREKVADFFRRVEDDHSHDFGFMATATEVFFGLGDYQKALLYLKRVTDLSRESGYSDLEGVARQLKEIARLHGVRFDLPPEQTSDDATPARRVLESALPSVPFVDLGDQLGLALSGGGFRASLFHIGVLAALADADLLRRVEVISCVSGGSIIGAYYYLKVRRLLQEREGDEIGRQHYIDLVNELATDFMTFVGTNVRTRLFADPSVEVRVMLSNYTHTRYLGDLLDAELYSRVTDDGSSACWLNHLQIRPKGEDDSFSPRRDNWRRRAKVPMLILNATTLNTGHLWQFTTSWMGEPVARIDPRVDHRERLRRMYYAEAPAPFQKMRLGYAVAASTAVPGIFEPLLLEGLYPDRKIRLVDGGVYDNQGVEGVLMEGCNVVFVSDASGPVGTENHPAGGRVRPALRSSNISMSLVRDRQYENLSLLSTGGILRDSHWVHLEQHRGSAGVVNWVGSGDLTPDLLTSYSVPRAVQEKIAAIRTDLDTFSEAEGYTLMTTGYRMAQRTTPDGQTEQWGFLEVEPIMMNKPGFERAHVELLKLLDAGSETFFKLWRLMPMLRLVTKIIGVLTLGALLYTGFVLPDWGYFGLSFNIRIIAVIVGVFLGFLFLLNRARKYFNFDGTLPEMAVSIGVIVFGWVLAVVHIKVFDRVFKVLGSMKRLRGLTRQS